VDVHARDIVADLLKHSIEDVNDFEWQMQLRYYFENEDVAVRQVCGVGKESGINRTGEYPP
jgi:dynein heavy chain